MLSPAIGYLSNLNLDSNLDLSFFFMFEDSGETWYYPKKIPFKSNRTPVNAVAFHPNGCFLAAGDDDGHVLIYDCQTGEVIRKLETNSDRGAVSSVSWYKAFFSDTGSSILLFGCMDGSLHQYSCNSHMTFVNLDVIKPFQHTIEGTDICYQSRRVAVISNSSLAVLQSRVDCTLIPCWVYTHSKGYKARTVQFYSKGEYILLCFLEGREAVFKFHARTGELLERAKVDTRIGTSAISPDSRHFIIGNLSSGVDLYDLETMKFIRTFQNKSTINVPKQVGFLSDTSFFSGSDQGYIFIWSTGGKLLQTPFTKKDLKLIQIVNAYTSANSDSQLIAAIGRDMEPSNPLEYLHLWKRFPLPWWRGRWFTQSSSLLFIIGILILIICSTTRVEPIQEGFQFSVDLGIIEGSYIL